MITSVYFVNAHKANVERENEREKGRGGREGVRREREERWGERGSKERGERESKERGERGG